MPERRCFLTGPFHRGNNSKNGPIVSIFPIVSTENELFPLDSIEPKKLIVSMKIPLTRARARGNCFHLNRGNNRKYGINPHCFHARVKQTGPPTGDSPSRNRL